MATRVQLERIARRLLGWTDLVQPGGANYGDMKFRDEDGNWLAEIPEIENDGDLIARLVIRAMAAGVAFVSAGRIATGLRVRLSKAGFIGTGVDDSPAKALVRCLVDLADQGAF